MAIEEKEIMDEQSAEELLKEINAAQQAEPAEEKAEEPVAEKVEEPKADPNEVSYTAADGTVYKAANDQELFKKVTSALNHTKITLKDREHQIHDLRSQQPKKEEPVVPAPEFDQKTYLALMETDARKARAYLNSFDPDIQASREARAKDDDQTRRKVEADKFYGENPDYVKIATPEVDQIMLARIAEKNRPFTAEAIGYTYFELLREKKIPGPEAQGEPVTKRKAMPTSAAGTTVESGTVDHDYDNMKIEELRKHLKKGGVSGAEYLPN